MARATALTTVPTRIAYGLSMSRTFSSEARGSDANDNGTLDASEVASSEYFCNQAVAADSGVCVFPASWEATSKSIPGAGITRGRDKIIDDFLAPVRGLFLPGDPKIEILRIFSKGNWVAAETQAHGTLASGKPYDNRYAWIVEIRDGKVCTLREYMDSAYILEQLDMKPE